MMLWPGAATSSSAVSKFCGILGNGQARPEMIEMSSRYNASLFRKNSDFH